MRATWVPEVLDNFGVRVQTYSGWETRGSETFDPKGVVAHHTATNARPQRDVELCINGRPDLSGPLCQIVLDREGICHVIAAGRANHAGKGGWRQLTGNRSVFGIEASNRGTGEPWPAVQLDAYVRCAAALLHRLGQSSDNCCSHKEWAPGRKIDPQGIDMNDFRASVENLLRNPPGPRAHSGGRMLLGDYQVVVPSGSPSTEPVPFIALDAKQKKLLAFNGAEVDGPGGMTESSGALSVQLPAVTADVIGFAEAPEGTAVLVFLSNGEALRFDYVR